MPSPMPEHRAGLLLAAGLASRMDHRPKALLQRDGVSLVRRNATALLDWGLTQLVVVVGHHGAALREALAGLPVECVPNPEPETGQARSLQMGLQALPPQTESLMIALADMPLLQAEDVHELGRAFDARPPTADFVQPIRGDERGNPVVISARLFQEWRASPQPVLGQAWQQQHPARVHAWPTANPHFFVDLDTPDDLLTLHAQYGIALHWPAPPTSPRTSP